MLDVDKLQVPMRETHASGVNLSYEWRMTQLRKLLQMVKDGSDQLRDALCLDLGRDPCEATVNEQVLLERDIRYTMKHLKSWMRPEAVPSPMVMIPAFSYLERKPLQAPGVLIIGPYNYPVKLVLHPLLGALSGGNPAVIKPSDFTPNVSKVVKTLVESHFEPGVVQVVLGGVAETTALLEKKWAKVFFTGSERVGKIVQKACAETMTPTILELGGKCPVVVDETVSTGHIENVAERIIWAKCQNAGQTCIAPDTLFVHENHTTALTQAMVRAIQTQFGEDPQTGELARIVNQANATRVLSLVEDAESRGAKVIHGGSQLCEVERKYICPTLLLNPPAPSRILHEEIFGPVLAIVTVSSREEAIQKVQELPGIPLQLHVFTPSTDVFRQFTDQCRSAGAVRNDMLIQGTSQYLPLGGLGSSGHGNYLGRHSFDTFTHTFPTAHRPLGSVWDLAKLRSHPYEGTKASILPLLGLYLPDVAVLHTRLVLLLLILAAAAWICYAVITS